MTSVYHIVTIRVNETSWVHVWRLRFRYLGTEYDTWFVPQNQTGFGLSVAPQNRRREVGAGHASRSSSLLSVEVSLARVSQFGLKNGGGATMGGARGTIVEVASETS
jgi:hypothetical protein